ncbi:type 1 glutamine amidotransferase [Actibacterium sp. MT2.3-13A]|uniref:type 1 glutamine amidotransferase n=1 Tax=Actibacterium sp. MT2.3-13A TaxID=2828332 RepID=UPI001BA80111|nr:type 1 glutamine amidotransferase [Actibacterium sp. MT2.3-13A]
MRIGILQTGHAPEPVQDELGEYSDMFERLLAGRGFSFARYDVVDMEFPDSVRAADGWLITGSKHGAYEDLPFIAPLEAFIREAYAAHVPIVGICFGHQVIAQALGGKVEKFAGGWAVGPTTYRMGERELSLNAWHQDQVTELPEGAQVIGGNDFCRNAALAYDDRILSVQPHPEFTARMMQLLIEQRGRGVVPDDLLDSALTKLEAPSDSAALAEQIGAFFNKPRG